MQSFSSQITFLNFRDYEKGKKFVSVVLRLKAVYDIGWAVVYKISDQAFLGVVDHSRQEKTDIRDGMLISLTTNEIEEWHSHISGYLQTSPIREIPDAGLKSFFFTGPEGFQFEIQQFVSGEARKLFY